MGPGRVWPLTELSCTFPTIWRCHSGAFSALGADKPLLTRPRTPPAFLLSQDAGNVGALHFRGVIRVNCSDEGDDAAVIAGLKDIGRSAAQR